MSTIATVHRLSVSGRKGKKKSNVAEVELREDYGIVGDAHAGSPRQVSLLPLESFAKITSQGLNVEPGEFAENITTTNLDFRHIDIGDVLCIGETVQLRITHIGKECHNGCYIRETVGDCIMPREGVFACVVASGRIRIGDTIVRAGSTIQSGSTRNIRSGSVGRA